MRRAVQQGVSRHRCNLVSFRRAQQAGEILADNICAAQNPNRSDLRAVHQIFVPRRRSAFNTTEMDEALIAKAANIGLIRMPRKGYSTPAATGTPEAL